MLSLMLFLPVTLEVSHASMSGEHGTVEYTITSSVKYFDCADDLGLLSYRVMDLRSGFGERGDLTNVCLMIGRRNCQSIDYTLRKGGN